MKLNNNLLVLVLVFLSVIVVSTLLSVEQGNKESFVDKSLFEFSPQSKEFIDSPISRSKYIRYTKYPIVPYLIPSYRKKLIQQKKIYNKLNPKRQSSNSTNTTQIKLGGNEREQRKKRTTPRYLEFISKLTKHLNKQRIKTRGQRNNTIKSNNAEAFCLGHLTKQQEKEMIRNTFGEYSKISNNNEGSEGKCVQLANYICSKPIETNSLHQREFPKQSKIKSYQKHSEPLTMNVDCFNTVYNCCNFSKTV